MLGSREPTAAIGYTQRPRMCDLRRVAIPLRGHFVDGLDPRTVTSVSCHVRQPSDTVTHVLDGAQ